MSLKVGFSLALSFCCFAFLFEVREGFFVARSAMNDSPRVALCFPEVFLSIAGQRDSPRWLVCAYPTKKATAETYARMWDIILWSFNIVWLGRAPTLRWVGGTQVVWASQEKNTPKAISLF